MGARLIFFLRVLLLCLIAEPLFIHFILIINLKIEFCHFPLIG